MFDRMTDNKKAQQLCIAEPFYISGDSISAAMEMELHRGQLIEVISDVIDEQTCFLRDMVFMVV
ncbi:hypothetical protein VINE108521_03700 [Vibrio neonatus]